MCIFCGQPSRSDHYANMANFFTAMLPVILIGLYKVVKQVERVVAKKK